MYSPLNVGTKNALGFDQAARTVACMAHTLQLSEVKLADLSRVRFYVVAPESQIQTGAFNGPMNPSSILARIDERISQFSGPLA